MSKLNSSGVSLGTAVRLDPGVALVWDKSGILLDVTGGLVVGGVGDLPGVEWHEEERVHDHSHNSVKLQGFGEGSMAALVGENPDAGEDESLEDGVCCPGDAAGVLVWDVLDVGGGVREDGDVEVVANNVGHGANDGRFEAVLWDSIVDLLHGVRRQLELVAELVDVLLLLLLLVGSGIASCGLLYGGHLDVDTYTLVRTKI